MMNRIKAPVALVAGTLLLSGCSDLLDVDNPNNLVEEAIQQEAAANGVVNGALWHVSEALGDVWEGPAVVSNELYWIGSRDAWGALDQGFISDNLNEFTDAAFPNLGQAAWMAQNAVEILEFHTANAAVPGDFAVDRGRAYMLRGMILMVIAEQQQDMTFSYKQTDGAPVSSGNAMLGLGTDEVAAIALPSMDAVMDQAIADLTEALTEFGGEADLMLDTRALLMRAEMSEEIMAARTSPCDGTVAGCAINFADALPHAEYVLDNGDTDYRFNLAFSAASTDCNMCGNVNDRKENQIDLSLVTVDASNDIDGINLKDVVDGTTDDPALISLLNQWKGGSYLDSGNQYPDLTVSGARLAHLIRAESAAAQGVDVDGLDFVGHIEALRAIDSYQDTYAGGNEVATLIHHRRVNTLLQGLWLQDMYRWGLEPQVSEGTITAATWAPTAASRSQEMLPITIIEVRANCYLNSNPCPGG